MQHAGCVEKDSRDYAGRVDSRASRPSGACHIDRGEGPIRSPQEAVESGGGIVSRERACGVNRVDLKILGARDVESGEGSVGRPHEAMRHVACVSVISCGRTRRIDADGGAGKISRDEGAVRGAQETNEAGSRATEISCKGSRRVDR